VRRRGWVEEHRKAKRAPQRKKTRSVEQGGKDIPNKEQMLRSKIRIESRQWLMSRRDPKQWGDKSSVDVSANIMLLSPEERVQKALVLFDLMEKSSATVLLSTRPWSTIRAMTISRFLKSQKDASEAENPIFPFCSQNPRKQNPLGSPYNARRRCPGYHSGRSSPPHNIRRNPGDFRHISSVPAILPTTSHAVGVRIGASSTCCGATAKPIDWHPIRR
jgi:hypothetical protein